jgi:hypothetical protein
MHYRIAFFIASFIFVQQYVFAEESDIKITPSGFAYYQIGQIEHQTPSESGLDKPFDQHVNGRMTLEAVIQERLRIIIGGEAQLGLNVNDEKKNPEYQYINLKEAQGIYSFGNPEKSILKIAAGYFPFKYNPEASNLGEYLYRTGSYPGYIITDFDFARVRLLGFNFSSILFDNLQLNALFTSEYAVNPYFDYSLSFVAGYKLPNKILDFGAGVDFDRILPIVPSKTTIPSNFATDDSSRPIIENGDTLRYTMQGTKLMGRVTFDPKPLLPFVDIFGAADGKLYAEVAVLGLKNYGTYFDNISNRIPVMVGFNIPCFKFMDVLSYEMEYYWSKPNQKLDIPSGGDPTPTPFSGNVTKSNIKWSFFGQKTLTKGIAIKGLIGRDHYRTVDAGDNYDLVEKMNSSQDWHYNLRLMYSF